MKLVLVLFVISAMLVIANAEMTIKDLLKMYDMSQNGIANNVKVATEALYIPMSLKECTNYICEEVCKALGFHHGVCVSSTTCHCSN